MKTIPTYVEKPMSDEWTIYAICIDKTGSKQLHRFSRVAETEPVIGSYFESSGKMYCVERVEKA